MRIYFETLLRFTYMIMRCLLIILLDAGITRCNSKLEFLHENMCLNWLKWILTSFLELLYFYYYYKKVNSKNNDFSEKHVFYTFCVFFLQDKFSAC